MSRPAGVTATAVVQFLGSALTLLVAIAMAASSSLPGSPPDLAPGATVIGLMFVALAVLGIWTGTALLKLRPWARTSTLVFGGIMAAIGLMGMLVVALIPAIAMPDGRQQATLQAMRPVMMVTYAIPVAIGVWWLVYFNRAAIKAAFAAPDVAGEPEGRPLSISIIGWFTAIGGAFLVPFAFSGFPAFLAGVTFTGFSAKLVYVLMGVTGLYLGWSVLKLQEIGRRAMIGYYALTMAHSLVVSLVPGMRAKLAAAQRTMALDTSAPVPFDYTSTSMTVVFMGMGVVFGAVVIWFLVKQRARFS